MNRELKFRAWANSNKMWGWNSLYACFENKESGHMPFGNFYNKPYAILMQFAGLKDVSGRDIYEGDIIVNPKATEPETTGFIVVWENFGFKFKTNFTVNNEFEYLEPFDTSSFEIVGNIYENPELIQS